MSSNPSLAQFVAHKLGGIRFDENNRGEMENVRATNKYLRGKNSVYRPSGQPADLACVYAREEGFNVDESTFLDVLADDAHAWGQGSLRNRVFREYVIDADTEYLAYFEEVGEAARALLEQACKDDSPLDYEDCYCDFVPVKSLSWEIQEILIDTLEAIV